MAVECSVSRAGANQRRKRDHPREEKSRSDDQKEEADFNSLSFPKSCPTPQFAIASLSLGSYLYHSLPTKIKVASSLGYNGIEIFMVDFEGFVTEVINGQHHHLFDEPFTPHSLSTPDLERECAKVITALCVSHNLTIPVVQPLRNFENFKTQEDVQAGLDGAERWLRLMKYFQCDLILVCSNHVPGLHPITDTYTVEMYLDAQVDAFRRLGELAATYDVRIGYEPLSWGTVVDNWEPVWDVVQRVNLPNVGIILDSFNTPVRFTLPL